MRTQVPGTIEKGWSSIPVAETQTPSGLGVRALGVHALGLKLQLFHFHPNLHLGLSGEKKMERKRIASASK